LAVQDLAWHLLFEGTAQARSIIVSHHLTKSTTPKSQRLRPVDPHSRPSTLHRRGLQHPQTPLCARLSEPCAIRGSPRPATCQKRRPKLSTIRSALRCRVKFGRRLTGGMMHCSEQRAQCSATRSLYVARSTQVHARNEPSRGANSELSVA
jgi:hypothetical protein